MLLTHGHFDHMIGAGCIDEIVAGAGLCGGGRPGDPDGSPVESVRYIYGRLYIFRSTECESDGQILSFAGYEFQVIHTPGHTRGGCCYIRGIGTCAVQRDTLFQNSVGRSDFPNSSTSDLIRSVREKLLLLPDDTVVYPGHMGETTIGHERDYNPYL